MSVMWWRSKWIVTVALLAFVLLGGALGVVAQEKPVLTLWGWHVIEDPQVVMPILHEFEQKYDVIIKAEGYGFPEMPKKLLTACEAGAMPDIMEVWASNLIPILAEKGCLEKLDPYIEEGRIDINRFYPSTITRYRGSVYSLPQFAYNLELLYNTSIFKEEYKLPTTWAEFEDLLAALTDKEKGQYGIAIPGNDAETLLYLAQFIAANGGRVGVPPELGKFPSREVTLEDIGINKPKAVEALEFALHLAKEYGTPFVGTTYKMAREQFIRGRAAILYDGPHSIGFLGSNYHPDFRIGGARFPIGPVGKPAAALAPGDTDWAISSTCKHKDLALAFLDYITSREVALRWAQQVSWPTTGNRYVAAAYVDPDNRVLPALEQFEGKAPDWYIITPYQNMPPQLEAALDVFRIEIQAAALGQKTVQEAMDEVAKQWKQLWDEWAEAYPH